MLQNICLKLPESNYVDSMSAKVGVWQKQLRILRFGCENSGI